MSDSLPIVDAHHHLWDLERLHYPFLAEPEPDFFLGDYAAIRRTYLPADYRRDAAGHRVVATVHVEAECDRGLQAEETAWLETQHAESGMPNAIVGHAWLHADNLEAILDRHAASALFRGIRSKPVTMPERHLLADYRPGAPGTLADPAWRRGLAVLQERGLSWDLRVPTWHLEEAAETVRLFPGLAVVLNHAGFPWDRSPEGLALWRQGVQALAELPNVMVKLSCLCLRDPGEGAWTVESNGPIVEELIDLFGPRRCMFASNFPVDSLRASFDTIFSGFKEIVAGRPRAEQVDLFAGNAARFYRLDLPPGTLDA